MSSKQLPYADKAKYFQLVVKAKKSIDDLISLNNKQFTGSTMSLSGLFKKHFHGIADETFSELDIEDLADHYEELPKLRLSVMKNGLYADGTYKSLPFNFEYGNVFFESEDKANPDYTGIPFVCLIGASAVEFGVYFSFELNENTGYAEGKIFVRKSPTERLKFLSTFTIVTDSVKSEYKSIEGETKEIKQLATNPSWLSNTVAQIEANVFRQFK